MINISQVTYLAREAFRTMGRHRGVTFVSIVIMSLSLLILAVFLMVTDNMFMFMEKTKEDLVIYTYLQDGLDESYVNALYGKILSLGAVEQVVFISKEQALSEFRREMGEERSLLEALDANPLPASFRITLKDEFKNKESIEETASAIAAMDGVEEVSYGKEFLDKFSSITRAVLYMDAVIGFIVVLSSIFIISNTVRLAVVSRKATIDILKLVGATNRFITMPFLIEGAFQGTVAALLSLLLLSIIYLGSRNFVPALTFFSAEKALLYVLVCLVMGAVGSYAALRKFLKI